MRKRTFEFQKMRGISWGYGLDRAGSGYGHVEGNCECGNELSNSIKFGEFLDLMKTGWLLKKDSAPCSKTSA